MTRGLYDEIERLNVEVELGDIDPADQPGSLARHLGRLLTRKLVAERDPVRR